ncbi:hypothetical protein NKG94_44550 [Micromonospora sp. M12]
MRSMAEQGGQAGPVTELARQAADRVHGVAGWLEERDPGDMLNEVRDYARRNPGTFLVGAAVLGVLAGRLTRGISAASDDSTGGTSTYRGAGAYDPEQTAVIPTQPPAPARCRTPSRRAATSTRPRHAHPADVRWLRRPTPGGYADPTPGGSVEPTRATTGALRHRSAVAAGDPDRPAAGRAVQRQPRP